MRISLLASVSALVLSSSAVMAADLPVKARPMPALPAPALWTGFYAGLNAGYAWGNTDPTLVGNFDVTLPGLSPRGFIGGGQLGYNWQTGPWVLGGEIDFSGLDVKKTADSPFFYGKGQSAPVSFSSRYDWLFTARVRAGYTVAPNWLLYVTGGLAVTHARDSVFDTYLGDSWSDSKTLVGGTVGGGVEAFFAPNWTARVEYLFAKFDDTTANYTPAPGVVIIGPSTPPVFSFQHDLNIVRAAVNYKFSP